MKKVILAVLFLAMGSLSAQNYTRWVNPFVGTGGHGHTFPGATLPFGMVQLSPDTRLDTWDGCSGYHYSDSVIYGFSHTHLSGTGCSDYGDILLMPRTGEVVWESGYKDESNQGYASAFSHEKEKAEPGYYSVFLEDFDVVAELTATVRTGLHRYTFPASESAHVLIDLTHRDHVLASALEISGDNEISGFRRSRAWAQDQHVYFVARFSKPFSKADLASDNAVQDDAKSLDGLNLKAALYFNTEAGEMILVKVGISAVSVENARKNLEAEQKGFDFEGTCQAAQSAWNGVLSKVAVSGGSDAEKTAFYSALYHSCIAPNLYVDVDGQYRGRDLKVHKTDGHGYYTVFSLWDTFRAAHPLFTLLEQKRTVDFVKTMLLQYEEGGRLPVWELGANETDCMIGYHSIPVIADAWMKGIRDFDGELALKAMLASAEGDRDGIPEYREYGYIPGDLEPESVSKTLEYAYDDWCIAQVAKSLGHDKIYDRYMLRGQYYKNIYNPESGFMQPKLNGKFQQPFDPTEVNFHFTEANSWQYTFFAPQDIQGMMDLMGGNDHFASRLDALFTASSETSGRHQADITGLIGQYAHGNEPSHHMAYLYNNAGQPWKTQAMVRQIMNSMYSDQPDGLSGNEDCGQMSAWLVLSAMGIYSVTPGDTVYAIGSPMFDKAAIHLENGRTFTIEARNNSPQNVYIQKATCNGQPFDQSYIDHSQILAGGTLVLEMGPEPNEQWGQKRHNTHITHNPLVRVPVVSKGQTTFYDETTVVLTADEGCRIHYTLDGTAVDGKAPVYKQPITLKESGVLNAVAVDASGRSSHAMRAQFHRIPQMRTIQYAIPYSPQYTAGGDKALIDFIRGGNDFRTGLWQGFWGTGFDATVDLGNVQPVSRVAVGFLQNEYSWIFMPASVEIQLSEDGETFKTVKVGGLGVGERSKGGIIRDFEARFKTRSARYVRVVAKDGGPIPEWHPAHGDKRWMFVDEIVVE